jgi:alkanesulfonate monooxygenase SsuD/methylene tetrahydromethanopterin reductase-like flavin-dependent oxidoreductase (luciferase family)
MHAVAVGDVGPGRPQVPDDLVVRITASGTPEEARAKVDEYCRTGCTCPILYPVGGDVRLLIDTFSPAPAGPR